VLVVVADWPETGGLRGSDWWTGVGWVEPGVVVVMEGDDDEL